MGRGTYNVAEAAELLGVSQGSLREAIRTGQVQVLRIGKRILIPQKSLEDLGVFQSPSATPRVENPAETVDWRPTPFDSPELRRLKGMLGELSRIASLLAQDYDRILSLESSLSVEFCRQQCQVLSAQRWQELQDIMGKIAKVHKDIQRVVSR